jgi:hypothetical protein
MKTNSTISKLLILFAWMTIHSISMLAQKDSSFVILRNGVAATFPFKTYSSASQMKTATGQSFPAYTFDSKQLQRINELLALFSQNETNYNQLRALTAKKDSIIQSKISIIQQNDSLETQRTNNYKSAFTQLSDLNKKMDADLKACEQLAIATNRNKTRNTILVGAGSLAVGLLLGLVIR